MSTPLLGFLSAAEWSALRLSVLVSLCAATAGLPIAVLVGYWLARSRWGARWIVDAIVNVPLVLPPVVTGYLLLICFSPRGPVGGVLESWFGVRIVFTWVGAVLAAGVVSFPLMVRAIRLAFEQTDSRLELAARGLGAGPIAAFVTVALPLASRGLIAGWVLAFARSVGEFGATIMVAGNIAGQTRTIPLAIYSQANQPGGFEAAWRLVVLSVVLACAALAASELLERRHRRRMA